MTCSHSSHCSCHNVIVARMTHPCQTIHSGWCLCHWNNSCHHPLSTVTTVQPVANHWQTDYCDLLDSFHLLLESGIIKVSIWVGTRMIASIALTGRACKLFKGNRLWNLMTGSVAVVCGPEQCWTPVCTQGPWPGYYLYMWSQSEREADVYLCFSFWINLNRWNTCSTREITFIGSLPMWGEGKGTCGMKPETRVQWKTCWVSH